MADNAVLTGFEPAASTLTGWRSLQTDLQDLAHDKRAEPKTLANRCVARTPNGIRTRVSGVKGRRPRPLDDGGLMAIAANGTVYRHQPFP